MMPTTCRLPSLCHSLRRKDRANTQESTYSAMSRQGQLGGAPALWFEYASMLRPGQPGEAHNVSLNQTCCALCRADAITQGVPVSVLDDEYGRSTVAMAALVDKFAALDLYDPERVKVSSCVSCNNKHMCVVSRRLLDGTFFSFCSLLRNRALKCMLHAYARS